MRPHHHLQSRRERMVRSAFRSFIATPATGQVKFPAGAKVALRAVGGGGGSPVTCAYVFNSADAVAQSFGMTGAVDSTGDQSWRHIAAGGAVTEEYLTTNSAFATVDYTTGIKAVEMVFGSAVAALESPGLVGVGFNVVNLATPEILINVAYRVSSSGITVLVAGSGGSVVGSVSAGMSAVVGLEINSVTGKFRVLVNNVPVTLSNDNIAVDNLILAIRSSEQNVTEVGDVGVTLNGLVRTAASDMTQTYTTGATDICGNEISAGGGGGSIAEGTTAATITGPQTRTIKTPEMAAGDLLFVDWVNKGSTVTPQANFELLVHVGLGVYKKVSTGA